MLDEATNALDQDKERAVLAKVFADKARTIIMIAHRQSAVKPQDTVFRLSEGRLVEA